MAVEEKARHIEPRPVFNPKVLELETAKEILAEIFGAKPSEVEEMIQRRLEERSWAAELSEERVFWPEEREEGTMPGDVLYGE